MAKKKKKTQLGDLPPQHKFFLNPYQDARFTRCPECARQMKARKKPFLIHIDPKELVMLNMTGRYCPDCDLIIVHQDVLENLLAMTFEAVNPLLIGNYYFVIGTVERAYWRKSKGNATQGDTIANLHDFKQHVIYEPAYYGWGPDPDAKRDETS